MSDESGVQAPTVNTAARCHCGFSQTIIQGVPNLSVSIANYMGKKVSPLVPEIVDLLLGLTVDLEGDGLAEFELWASV